MGKKNRKNKKQLKGRPDEILAGAPGLYMERYGNEIVAVNEMTPKQIRVMEEAYAEMFPAICDEIDKEVRQILLLIQNIDPISILHRAYWALLQVTMQESQGLNVEHQKVIIMRLMEYLQSFILFINYTETNLSQIEEEKWTQIVELFTRVFHKISNTYFMARTGYERLNNPDYNSKEDELYTFAVMNWVTVKGDRHEVHEEPHIRQLLKPHSEILKQIYGITSDQIVDAFADIQHYLNRGVFEAIKTIHNIYDNFLETAPASYSSADIKAYASQHSEDEIMSLWDKAFGYGLFNLKNITTLPDQFLDDLSYSPGELSSELPEDLTALLMQVLPIYIKPFLKVNETYWCFQHKNMFDKIYRLLYRIIKSYNPDYLNGWNEAQNKLSEDLSVSLIKKILPGSNVYRSCYYQWPSTSSDAKNWCETDALIEYDDSLIILEVRAGSFTWTSPFDDFKSYIASLKSLIQKPYNQAERFIQYFNSSHCPEIYCSELEGNKSLIRSFEVAKYRNIFSIAVSLDSYNLMMAKQQDFKHLDIEIGNNSFWWVSLSDLTIFSEIFDYPYQFIHFLEERTKINSFSDIRAPGEIDYLGIYLSGKRVSDVSFPIFFNGFAQIIDEYYHDLLVDPDNAIKPTLYLPDKMKEILNLISEQAKPGFMRVISYLLEMRMEDREEFNKSIITMIQRQQKSSNLMPITLINDINLTVFYIPHQIGQRNNGYRDYALSTLYANKEECRTYLLLEHDMAGQIVNIDWEFLTLSDIPIERESEIQQLSVKYQETRFRTSLKHRSNKKIGSNDNCPCGSRKKYKKCHGT